MLGREAPDRASATTLIAPPPDSGSQPATPITLLTIGENAKIEGKLDIADSIQIECEVGGELNVGGNVEITATGRVSGNIHTDSLVIAKGGAFNGDVVEIDEKGDDRDPGTVYLVEDKRAGRQK
jgi:cytoskeletal protein CcmA (bactofilin family)